MKYLCSSLPRFLCITRIIKKKLNAKMCSGSGFLLIVNSVSFVPVFCLIFHASIGLSINCSLSWYARDAGFSHMYTESLKNHFMKCEDHFLGWGTGMWCHILLAIISRLITRHYIYFFFYFDLIKFFFCGLRGCNRVSHLPKRLSSCVFIFLVNKRFQAEIAFNCKQPQVLG